jgi:hypothetical protein
MTILGQVLQKPEERTIETVEALRYSSQVVPSLHWHGGACSGWWAWVSALVTVTDLVFPYLSVYKDEHIDAILYSVALRLAVRARHHDFV